VSSEESGIHLEPNTEETESRMYSGRLQGERSCPNGYFALYEHENFNETYKARCLLSRVPFSPRETMFDDIFGCVSSVVNHTIYDAYLYAENGRGPIVIKAGESVPDLTKCKYSYRVAKTSWLSELMPFVMKQVVGNLVGRISPLPFLLKPLSNEINKKIDEADISFDTETYKVERDLEDNIESVIFNGLRSYDDLSFKPMNFLPADTPSRTISTIDKNRHRFERNSLLNSLRSRVTA
jgi:hypothetical protein